MRRRQFLAIAGGAAVLPLAVRAQQAGIRRVGVLVGYAENDPAAQSLVAAFRQALGKLGWTEGSNVRIDVRWGSEDPERIEKFAKELVKLQPDVILSQSTTATKFLAKETQTASIVFVIVSDPIGSGFAASFAHPGRNITGFTNVDTEMGGKWLQILKEIAPRTKRVALLYNPATAAPLKFYMPSIDAASSATAVSTREASIKTKADIESVISELAREPDTGIIALPDIFNTANRELIIALVARHGVPTIYAARFFAESGGLISYNPDFATLFRQAAAYVDRILKGEKPADLPIQLPSKFEMVINLKTAKALGLEVPPMMQQRADDVIE